MRTIYARVSNEHRLVLPDARNADHIMTFRIDSVYPDFSDATFEFGAGDSVRCKAVRLRVPGKSTARQRMVTVERIP